jgi:hypothetical protein
VDELRIGNPGWQYRFDDDAAIESFILTEYGEKILALYRRIDPLYGAARADLFRSISRCAPLPP